MDLHQPDVNEVAELLLVAELLAALHTEVQDVAPGGVVVRRLSGLPEAPERGDTTPSSEVGARGCPVDGQLEVEGSRNANEDILIGLDQLVVGREKRVEEPAPDAGTHHLGVACECRAELVLCPRDGQIDGCGQKLPRAVGDGVGPGNLDRD